MDENIAFKKKEKKRNKLHQYTAKHKHIMIGKTMQNKQTKIM